MRSLSQENPSNPNYYLALGEIYAMSKEHRRAILYYQKGLEVDPGASKLRLALARSYEAVGDLNRAVEEYQRASLKDRRNSEGFFKAAELVFQLKDYDATEKLLKHLLLVTPGYPGALRSLSRLYEETQKKDLATEYMEKEVANNPENLRYVLELAQLYMKYEQYSKAVEELKKVSSLPFQEKSEADKVRAYLLLSRCYRSLNKPESAEAAITLAVELDVNDPELQKELGYVYYSLHRDKEAVRAFESYLKRKPAAQDVQTIHGIITKIRIEP